MVSYNTTVALDAQDDRVKPGMSTTVSIIADARTDVLMVPNAAIKADDIGSYVEIMPASGGSAPARQAVETGLSNDEYTEIKSGLKEGDTIISGTVTTSAASTSNASSNRRAGGFMFGGGPDNH